MKKRKYRHPQICVIELETVGVIAQSFDSLPAGNPDDGNGPEPDADGYIWGE